jgi:hypothetical protein
MTHAPKVTPKRAPKRPQTRRIGRPQTPPTTYRLGAGWGMGGGVGGACAHKSAQVPGFRHQIATEPAATSPVTEPRCCAGGLSLWGSIAEPSIASHAPALPCARGSRGVPPPVGWVLPGTKTGRVHSRPDVSAAPEQRQGGSARPALLGTSYE